MALAFLREVFEEHRDEDYLVWNEQATSYGSLLQALDDWSRRLDEAGVGAGDVVALEADYTPAAVAALLALVERGGIAVPLSRAVAAQKDKLLDIAQAQFEIEFGTDDAAAIHRRREHARHDFYTSLRERGRPGLVVFSSGSTGDPKGAVHDFVPILEKFHVRRHRLRTLLFLLFDHLGGLNTLLYSLSNGGCCVTVSDRRPDAVLAAVARHRVELLPTSPTFLNLMLLGEAHARHDLSSLRTISYGTEPMPESTLHIWLQDSTAG